MYYKKRISWKLYSKGLIAFACAIFAFFLSSIFFFCRATDSLLFFASTDIERHTNWFYVLGANTHALLLYYVGSGWFFLIALLAESCWLMYHNESILKILIRLLGYVMLIVSFSAWQALYAMSITPSPFQAGGQLGYVIYESISNMCDAPIAYVIINAFLIMSILFLFRSFLFSMTCSFLKIMKDRRVQILVKYVTRLFIFVVRSIFYLGRSYGNYVRKIISGAYVVQSGQALREFEFDEIVHEAFLQQAQSNKDEVANEFIQNEACIEEKGDFKEVSNEFVHKSIFTNPPACLWKPFAKHSDQKNDAKEREMIAKLLEQKLERFGIRGSVVNIKMGPVVTLFEYQPHIDSKLSKIIALEDDLALALQAVSIRIIAPIPGKSVVGFEVANVVRSPVLFSSLVQNQTYLENEAFLPLILGVDTTGAPVIDDLATMPHMLLAGATGSGKSVALHTMIMSLLCRVAPDQLNLILIDPKRLEFFCYHDIPHLIFPIATHAKEAAGILRWVVKTMQERYKLLSIAGVRAIHEYNRLCDRDKSLELMPYLVIVIDELADLMMVSGKEIEESIIRIAQMARAAGIHMIVATQRPSVDVITGTIKVNFPTRISCKVSSKIDSRTILDCVGADKLLGKGDMLYLNSSSFIKRVHGAYVGDGEIQAVVTYLKEQRPVQYKSWQEEYDEEIDLADVDKKLFDDVLHFIQSIDKVSISLLQRRFKIGYNRSARIIEMLESHGYIVNTQEGRKVVRS